MQTPAYISIFAKIKNNKGRRHRSPYIFSNSSRSPFSPHPPPRLCCFSLGLQTQPFFQDNFLKFYHFFHELFLAFLILLCCPVYSTFTAKPACLAGSPASCQPSYTAGVHPRGLHLHSSLLYTPGSFFSCLPQSHHAPNSHASGNFFIYFFLLFCACSCSIGRSQAMD